MKNWKYVAYRSIWSALDLLYPPACGGCGKQGSRWCADCHSKVQVLNGIICDVCGLPQHNSGICRVCHVERPHFSSLRSWAVFDNPLKAALHRLKYHRDLSMGEALATAMLSFVAGLNWNIDLIVPIPLGKQRIRERGYNQVAMIAKPLALGLNIQYAPTVLARKKETRTQVGLSRVERYENVKDVFQATLGGHNKKTVLIIDDVSTTGSTLSSAAKALFHAGAKDVYALTVARALPHHDLRYV